MFTFADIMDNTENLFRAAIILAHKYEFSAVKAAPFSTFRLHPEFGLHEFPISGCLLARYGLLQIVFEIVRMHELWKKVFPQSMDLFHRIS